MNRPITLDDWMEYAQSVHFRSIDMTLDRVDQVYRRLAADLSASTIIIVGGTNGKGSSVAMLESIYGQAGYTSAAFTSPHLVDFNERFRFNRENLTDTELVSSFEKIDGLRGDTPLTYFEFATLVAIDCFSQKHPDVLIMETGMGGRLDSVNILNPDCVLLTHIALDHTQWLGDTREKIGREKAGLFRSRVPAICADLSPPASVLAHAQRIGADLKLINRDFEFASRKNDWDWQGMSDAYYQLEKLPPPSIPGKGQYKNASAVLMAIHSLAGRLQVQRPAIESGLVSAWVPGRLQHIEFDGRKIILDVAHNADAVTVLSEYLHDSPPNGQTLAVLGMLGDKDIQTALAPVFPYIDAWRLATLDEPRGAACGLLAEQLLQVDPSVQYNCHTSPVEAFTEAIRETENTDRIVVFGSFHTVGAVLSFIKQNIDYG